MDITVRAATVEDARPLASYLRALGAEGGLDLPQQPDELDVTLDDERQRLAELIEARGVHLLAERCGELIGELSVRGISRLVALCHVAELGMSVRADWRRRGVGSVLLGAAIEWAPRAGFSRLQLSVYARNTPAIRLYERFGFELEGRRRRFIRDGDDYVDDLIMARLL